MNLRRFIVGIVVFGLTVIFPVGASSAKTIIYHFHNTGQGQAWGDWVTKKAADFEKLNPDIHIEIVSSDMNVDQFTANYASGAPMDITELTLSVGGTLAPQGVFYDLRPFFESDKEVRLTDFAPAAIATTTWVDKSIWGYPADIYVVPTTFNADMFATAGMQNPIELDMGWNYTTALDATKKLTIDINGDGKLDQWGTNSHTLIWTERIATENRAGYLFDRVVNPSKSLLNTPKVLEGLKWMLELYRNHGVALEDETNISMWSGGFATGKIAWSVSNGPSTPQLMKSANATFNWGIGMPIAGEKRGAFIAVNSFQIVKTSKHPDIAFKWLKFLLGSQDAWNEYVKFTTRLPANVRAMRNWADIVRTQVTNPPIGLENYINAAAHPDSYPGFVGPFSTQINEIVNPLIEKVVAGLLAPESALDEAHRQVSVLLANVK